MLDLEILAWIMNTCNGSLPAARRCCAGWIRFVYSFNSLASVLLQDRLHKQAKAGRKDMQKFFSMLSMIMYDNVLYHSTFMGRIWKVNVYESVVLMSAACPPFNPCIQHPTLSLFKTFQASNLEVWTIRANVLLQCSQRECCKKSSLSATLNHNP